MDCGILAPQPGIELVPPALAARSLNHWTAREVPRMPFILDVNNGKNSANTLDFYYLWVKVKETDGTLMVKNLAD